VQTIAALFTTLLKQLTFFFLRSETIEEILSLFKDRENLII